jgi:DNA repair and recombination protein RAD54B
MSDLCRDDPLLHSSDTYKMFSRVYENPILKSRAPDCTPQEFEIGSGRAEQVGFVCYPLIIF